MKTAIATVRIGINKTILKIKTLLYKISKGKLCKGLFLMTVNTPELTTDVKILSENGEEVNIAKTDSQGNIKNEGFRILTTTDLHLKDTPELRRKTVQMLVSQAERVKPDLIILTGDIILSKYQPLDCEQFAQVMEKLGIYWTVVFGNHEGADEKGMFKYLMLETVRRHPHCLVRFGKKELFGYGNHRINIFNGKDSLLQTLYLFDSGRDLRDEYRKEYGVPESAKGYDFLKTNQIDWYKASVEDIKKKYGDVRSMMYMHIPLVEYGEAIELNEKGEYEFTDKCRYIYGAAYESVGSSEFNSGMFDAILECGSTQAIFSGHDHINDFCVEYKGIYLVYSQYDGYETYTMGSNFSWDEKDWPQGVTVTDIKPDGSLEISRRFNSELL
ncbi:MAG: metallophosphoesterase [Clostridiales bacterium]|nr:metallophosphoesterase [Clostridiales bacterium]